MPTKTWTGAGANELWSTGGNWNGGTVPAAGDDIIFDGVAANGKKNCTYNANFSAASVTFTSGYSDTLVAPFNGTFSFQNNLAFSGTLTLGANTTYTTPGLPTVYNVTVNGAAPGLVSNGKILPTNLLPNVSVGSTFTITGNADIGGNYLATTNAHNVKAATGTTVEFRVGGNFQANAMTTNINDHVTFKLYGTATKTFGGAGTNCKVSFVSGSGYTSSGNMSSGGTSFLTVDVGGRFNAVSTHFYNTNTGSLTVSGFNGLSDFYGLHNTFNIVLSTDTIVKSKVEFSTSPSTVASAAPGTAKLLLQGNLTSAGNSNLTIDRLEFSGTTTSNITSTSTGTLQVKDFIINKTSGGILNFNTPGIFSLFVPNNTTYLFTHTQGAVTQGLNNVIRFSGGNAASITSFSANPSLTTLRNIEVFGGQLSLNTQLTVTTLSITPNTNTTITSPALFGFTVETLIMINSSGAVRTVTLKSGVTYTVIAVFFALATNPAFPITLNASTVGTRANLNVEINGIPEVSYVNATDIDSSGTNGVLPFTKVTIYSLGGTIAATTRNWNTGNQPPPIVPSRTVAYTFVN